MTTGKIYQIAIDGPSGAGKSTIARTVARRLGIDYIDTGAMYRALGLKMLRQGIPMVEDARLLAMLEETDIDFAGGRVYLDGEDVSDSHPGNFQGGLGLLGFRGSAQKAGGAAAKDGTRQERDHGWT